jgi:hypothetical protein
MKNQKTSTSPGEQRPKQLQEGHRDGRGRAPARPVPKAGGTTALARKRPTAKLAKSDIPQVLIRWAACRLYDRCFEAHRGAFWLDKRRRIAVAFGNDGYDEDIRAQSEVDAVRCLLADQGGEEIGFATAGEGYTWALVCKLPAGVSPDTLEGVLWETWINAIDLQDPTDETDFFQSLQTTIAREAIARLGLL